MARATQASDLKTINRLERSVHVLARVRDELMAAAPSARTSRLLERNDKERAKIADKLGVLRGQPAPEQPARVK